MYVIEEMVEGFVGSVYMMEKLLESLLHRVDLIIKGTVLRIGKFVVVSASRCMMISLEIHSFIL